MGDGQNRPVRATGHRAVPTLLAACVLIGTLSGCVGVAYPTAPPPAPAVVYVQPQRYSIPSDVLFAFDSASLRPEASAALAQTLATIRRSIPDPSIRVEGNTDGIGTDGYNDRLSLRRADAVAAWLEAQGVPRARISTVGNGKRRPVVPNTLPDGRDNPQGRALNRRVDLVASAAG